MPSLTTQTWIRSGYETVGTELQAGNHALGRVSLLPWDTETFGFPVGTYETHADQLDPALQPDFVKLFHSWTLRSGVLLCSCSIPFGNAFWKAFLIERGFRFVDLSLRASLNGLRSAPLPPSRRMLRKAEAKDWERVAEIAAGSFRHGRYHADPLFPQELANRRYRDWMKRALSGERPADHVFILEEAGSVAGFYHVTVEDGVADLRLAAVSPEWQRTTLGFDLYVSVLHLLKGCGVRRVVTSISASNTGVLNVYSTLGFHFAEPAAIYHWHAPGFPKT